MAGKISAFFKPKAKEPEPKMIYWFDVWLRDMNMRGWLFGVV